MMVTNLISNPSAHVTLKLGEYTPITTRNKVMCELGEYQANKALLDGIGYFDGDTMPLA